MIKKSMILSAVLVGAICTVNAMQEIPAPAPESGSKIVGRGEVLFKSNGDNTISAIQEIYLAEHSGVVTVVVTKYLEECFSKYAVLDETYPSGKKYQTTIEADPSTIEYLKNAINEYEAKERKFRRYIQSNLV